MDTLITLTIVSSDIPFNLKEYQSIIGGIIWPSLGTRPDFAFVAGYLGRANASPITAYNTAQKRVLQYI
jgi:hypothetical protein